MFITEKEYLDQFRLLVERTFGGNAKYIKEYTEAMREYLTQLKTYYESAIQSAINILDRQIKKYEDLRDAEKKTYEDQIKANEKLIKEWEKKTKAIDKQIKALEREKKAIEKNYIKPLEKEIKAKQKILDQLNAEIEEIQKANEARQDAINLQRSLYELERARNQRTSLVFNGQQMVYRADDESVREKQQAYENAVYEHRLLIRQQEVDAIQKEIDLLQKRIDEYNEQIELIDEEIEKLNEVKEGYEEEIEKLQEKNEKLQENIDKIDEYYQKLIDGVNEYKKQWEELLEIEKEAQDLANLESLGISPESVLGLDPAAFETMKENYLSVLGAFYQENEAMIAKLIEVTGGELENYLTKTQELFNQLDGLNLETINTGIESAREGVSTVVDGLGEVAKGFVEIVGPQAEATYKQISDYGENAFDTVHTKASTSAEEIGKDIDSKVGGALQKLPKQAGTQGSNMVKAIQESFSGAEVTVKVKYDDSDRPKDVNSHGGGGRSLYEGTVGAAFANGTGYNGLDERQTALRSEYGQPELTVYPDGHYELTTQPTLSDLPKDTVIFNEEQTKRILNNSKQGKGKAFASGTTPLANVMPNTAALFENFEAQLINNVSAINSNIFDMKKDINDIASTLVSNVSNINSGGNVTVNGGVNITCPGVTSKEVTEDIAKQLNDVFFGMSTNAYQRAMTRK